MLSQHELETPGRTAALPNRPSARMSDNVRNLLQF